MVLQRPWATVTEDIFYYKGRDYLLVMDYFSKYPEVAHLCSKNSHSSSMECLEMAQSLANMLLLGNSCHHVTSKVHARSWLPLQRLNILSDAWSKLLNIFGYAVVRKPKYQGSGIFKIPPSSEKKKPKKAGERRYCTL